MRSVVVAVGLTCTIALFLAVVIAYMTAWPIALFNGGDPAAGWVIGFLLGGAAAGWWALRTSRSLLRDHARDGDVFRRPWPVAANVEALVAAGVLDRRRQPGSAAAWGDDLTADLRGGERAERMLVVEAAVHVHVAVTGSRGTSVRLVDVDHGTQLASVEPGRGARLHLDAGRWRVVLGRPGPNDGRREPAHAWWVAEAP